MFTVLVNVRLQGLFLWLNMKTIPKIELPGKPIYVKLASNVDFFALFKNIEKQYTTCFLYESLSDGEPFCRYSIIGFGPQHTISAKNNILQINAQKFRVDNPYETLRDIMPPLTLAKRYCGGLVGYLGYDAVNYMEPSVRVKVHKDFKQFMFGVYEDGVILDKLTGELIYFYYTTDRRKIIHPLLHKSRTLKPVGITYQKDTVTKKEHSHIVSNVKTEIAKGNIFQCEVGFKTRYSLTGDLLSVYENLRGINPSPFMYYLKFNKTIIIGASPELLFSLRDGEMTTKPLAGTTKRGRDNEDDMRLARALLNNPKEIAEHTMLVDLHRNDIGKVATHGSVKIRDFMNIKKLSHVQHISSEITGLIRPGEDMFSSLKANFPAGTLTGAPKIESIHIIDKNEPEARGPYGGGVGHFGFNGDCTFAIAIRSLYIVGKNAFTQTSGGIVYDSNANNEYKEIQNKSAALKLALNL